VKVEALEEVVVLTTVINTRNINGFEVGWIAENRNSVPL